MNRHLTPNELLSRLYGLGEQQAAEHVHECPQCAERLAVLERRRIESAAWPEPSSGFLAGQRRAIYSRLDRRPRTPLQWAPALAAVFLLAVGALVYGPARHAAQAPAPAAAHLEAGDDQLFSDVYSMEQSAEPRAAEPIHELFEEPEP